MNETHGFLTLGHSNWTICSLWSWFCSKIFHLFSFHTGRTNFLLPQREEGRKEQGLKMEKRESPRSEWDAGISDLVAIKFDHLIKFDLHSLKLILFQNVSTFSPFILGGPIFYYPRERNWREQGMKMGKRESPKGNNTQGFLTLENSNWNLCSLWSWFCSKIIPPFYLTYWEDQFLITPERGRKEQGLKMGKRESPKSEMRHETQGFLYLRTIWNLLNWFLSKTFPPFTPPPVINHLFVLQREGGRRAKYWKGNSTFSFRVSFAYACRATFRPAERAKANDVIEILSTNSVCGCAVAAVAAKVLDWIKWDHQSFFAICHALPCRQRHGKRRGQARCEENGLKTETWQTWLMANGW